MDVWNLLVGDPAKHTGKDGCKGKKGMMER